MHRCIDGDGIVPGKEAGLYLSGPIPELGQPQNRVTCQMALELKLVKPLMVEGAKRRGQPTQGSDKSQLCGNDVNNEPEAGLLGKRETALGFWLNLGKRISHCQKVRDQLVAAIRGKGKVTDSVGGIEGATYQFAAGQGMFRPGHHDVSERHIRSGL